MLVTAYLNDEAYQKFEYEAKSLNLTNGELAKKIIVLHMANSDEQKLFRLFKAVMDFFTFPASGNVTVKGQTLENMLAVMQQKKKVN
jgi:hypothetical protein